MTPALRNTTQIPSFSIILETENLSTTDIDGLDLCLASLASQTEISPAEANEFLLIDSGDTPDELLHQLCQKYPWIQVEHSGPGIGYYAAKMEGIAKVTGEVVLLVDSDCIYNSTWIKDMLAPFAEREDVKILGGETGIKGWAPYNLAMALTFFFDGYTGRTDLYESSTYYCNNVAFHRQFILEHPIPDDLPLYRGNCVIHTRSIYQQGYKVFRQPKAKAKHAPPEGLMNYIWRFLLIGRDNIALKRLVALDPHGTLVPKRATRSQKLVQRLRSSILENPWHLLSLPLAIPVVLFTMFLVQVGATISYFWPDFLLKVFSRIEGTEYTGWCDQREITYPVVEIARLQVDIAHSN